MRPRMALVVVVLFSTSSGKIVQISVSSTGFQPPSIDANIGDLVDINFSVGTATFTQSSLGQPCVHSGGIDSGLIVVPSGHGPHRFNFTVTSPDPLFFFNFVDQTIDKCKAGFIATINASAQQFAEFQNNAKSADGTMQPPQVVTPVTTVPSSVDQISQENARTFSGLSPMTFATGGILPPITAAVSSDQSLYDVINSATPTTTIFITVVPFYSTSAPWHAPTSSIASSGSSQPLSATPPGASNGLGQSIPVANRTKMIVVVIGVLLGIASFFTSVFVLVAWKRRRDRVALLPQTHLPNNAHRGIETVRRRTISSFHHVYARFVGMFSRRFGCNRMDENERTVSPFVAPDTVPVNKPALTPFIAARPQSPVSEVTLVPSYRGSETSGPRSDTSNLSLVVNFSRSEKDVGDEVQNEKDINSYPFVLSTNSGVSRLEKPLPSLSDNSSG